MFRVRILCEDRRTERFLRRLCELQGLQVIDVEVAPAGKGAGSGWVLQQYARRVRQRRSKNFQQNLGLLVHIDGDDRGVQARKAALDAELDAVSEPRREAKEPVAIFVPTWCIETWLLHLTGAAQPLETAKLKRDPDPTYRQALAQLAESEGSMLKDAAEAWHRGACSLPSLDDARSEVRRLQRT